MYNQFIPIDDNQCSLLYIIIALFLSSKLMFVFQTELIKLIKKMTETIKQIEEHFLRTIVSLDPNARQRAISSLIIRSALDSTNCYEVKVIKGH